MADLPLPLDAEITEDVQCVHCGYNLRGLSRDGLCPECGTPIARSVFGNQLGYADPAWLEKLRLGTTLKIWAIVLGFLMGFVVGAAVSAGLPTVLMTLVIVIAGALGLWATWLITTQEPRVAIDEDPVTLRKLVRFCAVAAFVGQSVNQLLEQGGAETSALYALGAILMLAGIVQYFGEIVYYRRFARRIPDPKLERSTTIVLWGLPACYAVLALGGAIVGISMLLATQRGAGAGPAGPGGAAVVVGGGVVCLGGVGALVFALAYIRLLFSYRKAFQEAAASAAGITSGAPQPA